MHGAIETAFIGRLGQGPELKSSAAGKLWARFSVAVGREDETKWVSVAVFGGTAERLSSPQGRSSPYRGNTAPERVDRTRWRDAHRPVGCGVEGGKAGRHRTQQAAETKGAQTSRMRRLEMDVSNTTSRYRPQRTLAYRSDRGGSRSATQMRLDLLSAFRTLQQNKPLRLSWETYFEGPRSRGQ